MRSSDRGESGAASLQLAGWAADGFTETGAGADNLTVAKQSATSLRSEVGAEAVSEWKTRGLTLVPHLRVAWLHEWDDDARRINATLGGTAFAVTSRPPQRDSAVLGGGLNLVLGPAKLLYTDLTIQTGDRLKVLAEWRAGLAIKF